MRLFRHIAGCRQDARSDSQRDSQTGSGRSSQWAWEWWGWELKRVYPPAEPGSHVRSPGVNRGSNKPTPGCEAEFMNGADSMMDVL